MSTNPSARSHDPLLLAGKIITFIMQIGLVIGGTALAILIPALVIFRGEANEKIAEAANNPDLALPLLHLVGVMAIGLLIVVMLFVFFGKLRAIIGTVGEGDPFAPANADRLSLMGWLMLGVQLLIFPAAWLGIALARFAEHFEEAHFTFSGGWDLEGLLLVIVLFILARVFRHGAAMREDLEGTV